MLKKTLMRVGWLKEEEVDEDVCRRLEEDRCLRGHKHKNLGATEAVLCSGEAMDLRKGAEDRKGGGRRFEEARLEERDRTESKEVVSLTEHQCACPGGGRSPHCKLAASALSSVREFVYWR